MSPFLEFAHNIVRYRDAVFTVGESSETIVEIATAMLYFGDQNAEQAGDISTGGQQGYENPVIASSGESKPGSYFENPYGQQTANG